MPRKFLGPLQPGRRTAMVPRRKPRPRKLTSVKKITSVMKTVALKQCETKRATRFKEDITLGHNQTHYTSSLLDTVQGINNPGGGEGTLQGFIRIGNEIIARGISFKLWMENNPDHPNLMFKVIVFKYNQRLSPVLDGQTADTILWQGGDGNGSIVNRMLDTIATNRVKVLFQQIVKPVPFNQLQGADDNIVASSKTTLIDKYINLNNMKLKYTANNGEDPFLTNVGLAIVPYDRFATQQDIPVAKFGFSIRSYFKDP